jgi:hypothetical protein
METQRPRRSRRFLPDFLWLRDGSDTKERTHPSGASGPAVTSQRNPGFPCFVSFVPFVFGSYLGIWDRNLDTSQKCPNRAIRRIALECGSLLPLWKRQARLSWIRQFLNPEASFRGSKRKQACALQESGRCVQVSGISQQPASPADRRRTADGRCQIADGKWQTSNGGDDRDWRS